MNDPEPTLHDLSGEDALLQFSAHPRWPQYPATLERLKAHPIAPAPNQVSKIDLEPHADYLESP
jgi:hypothetical protein